MVLATASSRASALSALMGASRCSVRSRPEVAATLAIDGRTSARGCDRGRRRGAQGRGRRRRYAMSDVLLACCQLAPQIGQLDANREATESAITAAAGNGAQIVVLPELAVSGYVFAGLEEARTLAEPLDGPTVTVWSELARAASPRDRRRGLRAWRQRRATQHRRARRLVWNTGGISQGAPLGSRVRGVHRGH